MSEAEDRLITPLEVAHNQENVALEKIFTECETPSTAGKVPVAKLTCYMRDQMSARGSPEILQDLRESLRSVSHHGEVTRKQFHVIARRWLDKIRQRQHRHEGHQDGNNNLSVEQISSENLIDDTSDHAGATTPERETSQGSRTTESSEDGRTLERQSFESDPRMLHGFLNISTSTIANDIKSANSSFENVSSIDGTYHFANTETPQELRLRAKKCAIDNDNLKGDLQRAEDSIVILEGQLEAIGRELEISSNRCERLQREVDNQKEVLAAIEKDRESVVVRSDNFESENSKLRTENFKLKREIDATDLEVRRLNAELTRTIQEKEKQIELRCYYQKELLEKQSRYDAARAHISKIELVNSELEERQMISTSTNEHLKTVVKELEDRVSELQLHRRYSSHRNEPLFGYSTSDDGLDGKVNRLPDLEESFQPSLLDEIKASECTDTDVNLNDETGELKNLKKIESIEYPRYLGALHDANQQMQRALSSLPASHKDLAVSPISFGADEPQLSELENYNYEDHLSERMELQRFKSQLHHVLAIISNLSSSKVTIADTKDATTQLDRLDLVPDSTPACNIHGDIMNYADNRIRYRREKRLQKEVYEKSGEETDRRKVFSIEAIRAASSPAGTTTSSEISLPSKVNCSSTPRSSPVASPSTEFHQDSIIAPIVAALDEIIQDTRNAADISSSSSSAGEANQSPVGLRRDHNPRYTYTLPSYSLAKPEEEVSQLLPDTEDTGLQHKDSSETELDPVSSTYNLSDKASRFGDEIFESSVWRCRRKSVGTDDNTSEETDITESNSSGGSRVTVDPTYSVHGLSSSRVLVDSSLRAITENDVIPSESSSYNQQIPSLSRSVTDPDPNCVDRLNSDLEKLTLHTSIMQVQGKSVPKRKSSVYHRSFDCSTLDVAPDQCTIVRRSVSSPNVPKSTIPIGGLLQTTYNVSGIKSSKEIGAEECEALVDSATDSCCSDKSELLENTGSFLEMGENMLSVSWKKDSQNEMGDYLDEDDSNCAEAAPTTALENTKGESDIPILTSTAKPTKSEVSLGNRRTKYVISGTWNLPLLPLPTPSLPPNAEELGDVDSADNAAKWRSSSDPEIPVRSRSLARTMSSDEDSSDSECIIRDRIDTGEQNLQVVAAEPPTLQPASLTPLQTQSTVRTKTHPLLYELPLSRGQQIDPQKFSSHNSAVFVCEQLSLSYRDDTDNNDNTAKRITAKSESNYKRSKDSERGRRSLSESDTAASCKDGECRCRCRCGFGWNSSRTGGQLETPEEEKRKDLENFGAFPSLPDSRLIELGLADTPEGHGLCERISEDELERKYTALSIGLGTDRITLPRRMALSLRHRDQAEQNLSTEVDRMQSDIQALAPLCVDRESVERVERVRHQLEMISRCALRVSCTAELLGATHQERRVSRASLLADRYLQALRGRCDKLTTDLAETKRILTENNIVVEENPSELVEDVLPRVRYRGVPSTNRTTISRRRASIATISRPTAVNSLQDTTKDSGRPQRISVSGRMTLRRPSLGYDTQRWDNEKLDRTDSSSSSIGELREIFEQAESRRGSREENNNLIRSQSSNFSVGSCESADSDVVWSITREDPPGSTLADTREDESFASAESTLVTSRRTPRTLRTLREQVSRLPIFWYILFVVTFFFGFYSNRYVTTRCTVPLKWWSAEELLKRYVHVKRNTPPPI
ncbi:uncharacterized protein LOC105691286 isoform X1 [Athalia rosae]|uniref:uncharacterized protein LOC105691286 isoform X1 n=1 Tax=Athalia rosae TaxID=37344 RepID=UPI002033FB81|nr:uncharacterized protein LOC105691286 isoform X1 [Athalia rosae]XP_048511630.1 uncharacterized protein LOC105691286 isoform X1 [Athalia rosae]